MARADWLMRALAAAILSTSAMGVSAATLCSDSFSEAVSCEWGNEVGDWFVAEGVYDAARTGGRPMAESSLPFDLTDFSVEVDIRDVQDGGLWLRSFATDVGQRGRAGVLLVTGGRGGAGTTLYWHIVRPGDGPLSVLSESANLFDPGVTDARIRVVVAGNTYSAYVDGSATPVSTLVTSEFSSGRVALYDNSIQTFDNFTLTAVPEPATAGLLAAGMFLVAWKGVRRAAAAMTATAA